MALKIYPYLGETRIAVDAPRQILYRIEGNIEESPLSEGTYEGLVKVNEGKLRDIQVDTSIKYASTKQNRERGVIGFDYFRYKTHIQTIWKNNDLEYEVRNHLPLNETGALKCFKKIYYALPPSNNKALINAVLVDINGKGVLLVGKYRSGKTTLALSLADSLGARFVEGGTTLLSHENGLKGYYVPRPIYIRFSSISNYPYLSDLLSGLDQTESQQPIDIDAIKRIIKAKAFHVDAGLNISRRRFSSLTNRATLDRTRIKTIIFPEFGGGSLTKLDSIDTTEGFDRLVRSEFLKDEELGKVQHQTEIQNPAESIISLEWVEGIKIKRLSFNRDKDLTKSLLEDLLS